MSLINGYTSEEAKEKGFEVNQRNKSSTNNTSMFSSEHDRDMWDRRSRMPRPILFNPNEDFYQSQQDKPRTEQQRIVDQVLRDIRNGR
jgi:hypothetical protein